MNLQAAHEAVLRFHHRFKCKINQRPVEEMDPELAVLRSNLILEEAAEFNAAADANDFVEMVDALGDIIYVTLGAAISMGVDLGPIIAEIHRSNMTKVWPDGTVRRREDGKIIKPPTYSPADIEFELRLQGWEGKRNDTIPGCSGLRFSDLTEAKEEPIVQK